MMLTVDQLREVVGCTQERAELFHDHLVGACAYYGITSNDRLAAFLAQVGHESGSFKYVRELASGEAYEGRKDLGNTEPGDGPRYRGRGLIQTTGRANYARVRDRLRARLAGDVPDFEAEPEALEQPKWAAWSAADYWDMRGLNALADAGNFEAITRKINGGLNGQADRIKRWERAKAVLLFVGEPSPASQPEAPQQPDPTTYTPAGEAGPQEATPMAPLLLALGSSLIDIFTPLAKEKITKEVSRHTNNPAVAEQIANVAIDTAKAATGLSDPIEAVAAAKKDPAVMAKVEASALDQLAKLAPLLDKMHAHEKEAWAAEESSRDEAAKRAAGDQWDMSRTLVVGAFGIIGSLILFVCVVAGFQAFRGDIKPEVWAQIAGLIGFATGVGTTIYAYRFGTSRSSATKDIVIGELSKRK